MIGRDGLIQCRLWGITAEGVGVDSGTHTTLETARQEARDLAKSALEEALFSEPWEKIPIETRTLISNLSRAIYDCLDREKTLEARV